MTRGGVLKVGTGRPARVSPRLVLLLVAGVLGVTGLAIAVAIAPNAWAVDAFRNLAAARDLTAGVFGREPGYLYTPLAAAFTVPATLIPTEAAVAAWFALRVALMIACVAAATRTLRPVDRILLAVATLGFIPTAYDLELGNVTVCIVAAIAVLAWRPDGMRNGVVLGVLLATVPKPQLIPVLGWMLIYRPRALTGSAATAALLTVAGVLALGVDPYRTWLEALGKPVGAAGSISGDFAVWVLPTGVAFAMAVVTTAIAARALKLGPGQGLLATVALGLLLAPYTIAYAAALVLVAVPWLAIRRPRWTMTFALVSPIMIPISLTAWAVGLIVLAAATPDRVRPGGSVDFEAARNPSSGPMPVSQLQPATPPLHPGATPP